MVVSKTSDHIQIKIKMPNPSQEPPVSSKAPNDDIARGRKKGIDQILIQYKKSVNDNLRYVVKNDEDDVKVLIRAYDEYDHVPYRELNLDILGKIPDFECITKSDNIPEAVMTSIEDPERFQITREERKRKKRQSPKKASKETIFARITRFLAGFEVDVEESSEEDEPELDILEEDHPSNVQTNV